MWEEDPRWQQRQFKILLSVALAAGLLRIGLAVYRREWTIGPSDVAALTLVAALFVYGVLVWTVGNGIRSMLRRRKRRDRRLR